MVRVAQLTVTVASAVFVEVDVFDSDRDTVDVAVPVLVHGVGGVGRGVVGWGGVGGRA